MASATFAENFFRLSHTGGADRCYRGQQPDVVRKRALHARPAAVAFGARVSLFSPNTHPARLPLSSHPCLRPFAPPTHCRSTRSCGQSVQSLSGSLEATRKMFVSDPSLKAAGEAADTFPHMHGTLRSYACTYCSAFRLTHPLLVCQPCYIGPRTWTGQQYCIRCLIRPGQNCI